MEPPGNPGRFSNAGHGILLSGDDNLVAGVVARRNGGDGIHVENGSSTAVTQSTANDNVGYGIRLMGERNAVVGSVAQRNGADGILVTGNFGTVLDSVAKRNTGVGGIRLEGDDSTIVRSQATRNGVPGSADYGGIGGLGQGLRVVRGVANQNAPAGIFGISPAIVVRSTAAKNDVGVSLNCPSNALLVQAPGNPDGNLLLLNPTPPCALLKTPAPVAP